MARKKPTYGLFTRLKAPEKSYGLSADQLEQVVGEEIVMLLNTRQWLSTFTAKHGECSLSTINYGIPDFSRINLEAAEDRRLFKKTIARQIKKYVSSFQLQGVEIEIDRSPGEGSGVLLRIAGHLPGAADERDVAYTVQIDPIARNFHL